MIYKPIHMLPDGGYVPEGQNISFSWTNSGDVMKAFQIDVYDNSTDTLVVSTGEITSYTAKYTLSTPLPIGGYKYKVTVYNDVSSNTNRGSAVSALMAFTVSAIPVVTLNIAPEDVITTQSLTVSADYIHPSGITMKHCRFVLYDAASTILETSTYLTDGTLSYTYQTLLSNQKSYYVQCVVADMNGIEGVSDKISFRTQYTKPQLSIDLTAKSEFQMPYVQLDWGIVRIIGTVAGHATYVDDTKLDVTAEGSSVYFDKGFVLDGDFTIDALLDSFQEKMDLLLLKNANISMKIQYYNGRFHLFVAEAAYKRHIMSAPVTVSAGAQVSLSIRQQNRYLDFIANAV